MTTPRWQSISILKTLIGTHVAVFVFGFLAFLLFLQHSSQNQLRNALLKTKETVQLTLSTHQDRWRSWHILGLRERLLQDLDRLRKEHPMVSVSFVERRNVTVSETSLVFPPEGHPDDLVMVAEISPGALGLQNHALEYAASAAIWLGSLFLVSLALSVHLVRKHIQTPLNQLRRRVSLLQSSGEFFVRDIPAKGEIRELLDLIATLHERTKQYEKLSAAGEIAQQVAHDIRSPLCALNLAASSASALPEAERRLIQSAISRINEIANNLGLKQKPNSNSSSPSQKNLPQYVLSLLSDVSLQKRIEFSRYSGISIVESGLREISRAFAIIDAAEFKTLVSNIINNARDAVGENGKIAISASYSDPTHLKICISDDGGGIDPQVIPRLTERGYSQGKKNGSGLGLFHAAENLRQWSGSLTIESTLGKGTRVAICIPTVQPPEWFHDKIQFTTDSELAIVDDDPSIHEFWEYRIGNLYRDSIRLNHFFSLEEVRYWAKRHADHKPILYLVDNEFVGSPHTGLDLINELGISDNSYLVTSSSNNPDVIARCVANGVRVIPKCTVDHLSIECERSEKSEIYV